MNIRSYLDWFLYLSPVDLHYVLGGEGRAGLRLLFSWLRQLLIVATEDVQTYDTFDFAQMVRSFPCSITVL